MWLNAPLWAMIQWYRAVLYTYTNLSSKENYNDSLIKFQNTPRQTLCSLVSRIRQTWMCGQWLSHISSDEHYKSSTVLPQHLDQGGDASRLENCKESFTMVGKVVQGSSRAASGLHITGVLHGTNNGRNHLWGAHQGVARCLLLRQLVHHYSCFIHNNLGQRHFVRGKWFKKGCKLHGYASQHCPLSTFIREFTQNILGPHRWAVWWAQGLHEWPAQHHLGS